MTSLPHRLLAPSLLVLALATTAGCPTRGGSGGGGSSNDPPSAPEIELSPAEPGIDDDLVMTITVESEDPDGDEVDYSISWTVDGEAVADLDGEDTVPADRTSIDEVWVVSVVADDGDDESDPATASVTVTNAKPEVTSLSINDGVFTDDVLVATFETADAEGDDVTVLLEWFVDGSKVDEDGASLSGVEHFDRDEEVWVVATPSDAFGTGDPVESNRVTVENTPPTAPLVEIDPREPTEGEDDLFCGIAVEADDADGESIEYDFSWTWDGNDYTGTTTVHTGDTVPGGDTLADEVWQCTVVASDGDLEAPPATDVVTVESALPDFIVDGTTTTLVAGTYAYDDVHVINGGVLEITGHVVIVADEFIVDATSTVDGAGAGHAGSTASATGAGPGGGGGSSNSGGGGGGYGGTGGGGGYDSGDTPGAGGITYGTETGAEVQIGSAGGGTGGMAGGSGGAALDVTADVVDVAGVVDVSGADALPSTDCAAGGGRCAGGGSGGGILLIGDVVTLTGTLDVSGGEGATGSEVFNDGGGGGGGGRVKVFHDASFTDLGTYTLGGGDGGASGDAANGADGQPGTVHSEQQPF